MRRKVVLAVSIIMAMSLMTACGASADTADVATEEIVTEAVEETEEETEAETEEVTEEVTEETASGTDGVWEYGEYTYTGDDNVIYAIDFFICDELAKGYDASDVGIPTIIEVARDDSDPEDIKVWGEFLYDTYDLVGDTMESQAGGSYPGCMHVKTTEAGCGYEVTGFDVVADGSDFDSSAKEIFGDKYDKFMEAYSDGDAKLEARKDAVDGYVKTHTVPATQFKDYGSDPIALSANSSEDENNQVVYMGGLYANDGESDINLALFKSAGTPVVVIQEGEHYYYGEFTTEEAKLEDGSEYIKITVEGKTFGYHFDDETAMSGFVVDQDGKSHTAVGLDESVANDMKKATE